MSRALGDYIHYTYKNYIGRKEDGVNHTKKYELPNSINNQRQYIEQKINKLKDTSSSLEILKQQLEQNPLGNQLSSMDIDFSEIIKNALIKKFENSKIGQGDIESFLNDTLNEKFLKGELEKNTDLLQIDDNLKKKLLPKIKTFLDHVNRINKSEKYNLGPNIEKLKEEYEEILNILHDAEIRITKKQNQLNEKFLDLDTSKTLKRNQKNVKILNNIRDYVKTLVVLGCLQQVQGAWGEMYVKSIDLKAKSLINKDINELIDYFADSLKQGTSGSSFSREGYIAHGVGDLLNAKIELSKPGNKDREEEILRDISMKDQFGIYQIQNSSNKIDAEITILDDNNIEQQINATIKTYSAHAVDSKNVNVHLQDIQLLDSLAATQDSFGTHWLNLHTTHPDISTVPVANTEADEVLKLTLAYEALAHGNMLKQDALEADTLVYIDPVFGKVKTFSNKKILQNLENFSFSPSINNIHYNNNYSDISAADRIADILFQVHQQKISCSYNIKFDK